MKYKRPTTISIQTIILLATRLTVFLVASCVFCPRCPSLYVRLHVPFNTIRTSALEVCSIIRSG